MKIAPISNNLNYRKTNVSTDKHKMSGKTGMTLPLTLPSFVDAKSFVNINFTGKRELFEAIRDGDLNRIESELDKGTDINSVDDQGNTPLLFAVKHHMNFPQVVEKLLEYPDIDVNKRDKQGLTALMGASFFYYPQTVEKILERPDVDVTIKDSYGDTAYDVANHQDIRDMISGYRLGVDKRKNVKNNVNSVTAEVNKPNRDGYTPLHRAVFQKDLEKVKELLENPDIDMNVQDNYGQTPLMKAFLYGTHNIIKEILEHPEVDTGIRDKRSMTASELADTYGKMLISRHERKFGKRQTVKTEDINTVINAVDPLLKQTALHTAIKKHDIDIVEELLRNPYIDVNKQNFVGNTPLMVAVTNNDKEMVEKILEHPDVDVNKRDKINDIALDIAKRCGYKDIENMIRSYKRGVDRRKNVTGTTRRSSDRPDVNAKDENGRTLLLNSVLSGDRERAKRLLDYPNIDVNTRDIRNNTVLMYAAQQKFTDIVEKILEHPDVDLSIRNYDGHTVDIYANDEIKELLRNYRYGVDRRKTVSRANPNADINKKDAYGQTVLHNAVNRNDLKAVEELLQNPELDVNIKTYSEVTPLILAIKQGKTKIAEKLLEHPDIDVNIQDSFKNTALIYALMCNDLKTAEKILELPDVDKHIKSNYGASAMDYACVNGNSDILTMLRNYKPGTDKRNITQTASTMPPLDIDKLSPEENIWSEEEIGKEFLSFVKGKYLDIASKMLDKTPLINLEGKDNEVMSAVCSTGDAEFIKKVFEYQKNQPEMRAEYDARRKEFLESKIKTLSYEELKENPVALNTEDGFKVLMSNPKFNPNDISGEKSLFEHACNIDSKGSMAKQILSKYDDVYTPKARMAHGKEIKDMIREYETSGKYKIKFDNIKRNISNPETRDIAIVQLKDFINSEEFTPDMTDTFGNSALHIVAALPDDSARGLIQKLLTKGVDINTGNITNQTALISAIKAMIISKNDEDKVKLLSNIKFLLDKEINVNAKDNNGQTALHLACMTTSPALLNLILSKEPNITAKDNLGHKANFYLKTPQMKEIYSNYVN